MKTAYSRGLVVVLVAALVTLSVPRYAGAVALTPGGTAPPTPFSGLPGTLLATLVAPASSSTATFSITLTSAVFRNAGGTLDFYYQISNSASSTGAIARFTTINFVGSTTDVGFRTDGGTLSGGLFVNGTKPPDSVDRSSAGAGATVAASFLASDSAKIQPGESSNVAVIKTNATTFAAGSVSVIDGGGATVASFQPVAPIAPPTIAKSFGAASVAVGATTSLSFTITNPNAGTALTGIGFTDSLPAGLVVSTPNALTGSCGGGTIAASAGSGSVSMTGATLTASASCTFSVNVTGTSAGLKTNTTGAVTSVEGGTGGTASANVTVVAVAATPTIAPTLQQWAVWVLGSLLTVIAGVTLRRRKKG